jgi:hypothetical protein
MNKPRAHEILQQLNGLPLEEREAIVAELLEGIHNEGGRVDGDIESDPGFIKELEGRADEALDHPDRAIPASESLAGARAALAASRASSKK